MSDSARRVVIVAGGFGGLAAAKALRKTDAQVVLVDRQNHHLFQPLLYQVATSLLSPGLLSRRIPVPAAGASGGPALPASERWWSRTARVAETMSRLNARPIIEMLVIARFAA
jgi:NAD(P)-dependent dehydrogenase (short-subunit alcohol dehydrogenase family)